MSMDVITQCRYWFGLLEMEMLTTKHKQRFLAKYVQPDNVLCQLFAHAECVTCGNLNIICFLFIVFILFLFAAN